MFTANTYRIMIGCPGDVHEEARIAQKAIIHWTNIHAESRGIVLLPIHWSSNSYPENGAHPQTILNSQLATKSDMLVGIFGSKVGTPTDKSHSGTIEEIEDHIKAGKPVMLFFRRQNDITSVSSSEIAKLQDFKNSIKDRCLYKEYDNAQSFEGVFSNSLELFLTDHWPKAPSTSSQQKETIHFSDEEGEILKQWVSSNNNTAFILNVLGGKIYVLGNRQCSVESGREEAQWNDFFDRMEKARLIKYCGRNRQGSPVYELQKRAYDLFG